MVDGGIIESWGIITVIGHGGPRKGMSVRPCEIRPGSGGFSLATENEQKLRVGLRNHRP